MLMFTAIKNAKDKNDYTICKNEIVTILGIDGGVFILQSLTFRYQYEISKQDFAKVFERM